MSKSPLLKKQALDALLDTMAEGLGRDNYDDLGAHRRGEPWLPEGKGTELNSVQDAGEVVTIPAALLAQAPDPATAEFFKESLPAVPGGPGSFRDKQMAMRDEHMKESHDFKDDPQVIPPEEEKAEHEFVKEAPKTAAPTQSRGQSPEWQRITDFLAKRGYRWMGNVSDGTELWANMEKQFHYDPATHVWNHKTKGKVDAEGAIEDLETRLPKVGALEKKDMPKSKYDKACYQIASNNDLWNLVVDYVQVPDAPIEKLEPILKTIPPFVPNSWSTKSLYRGEPHYSGEYNEDYHYRGKATWTGSHRSVLSWSSNWDTAKYFAEGKGFVWQTVGKVQGVALVDIVTWRNRIRDNESNYGGIQAEWFVLSNPLKAVEAQRPSNQPSRSSYVGSKYAHANEPDTGEYDYERERHIRAEAKQWSQYAEESDNNDELDVKPFDPAGNYLCGTCDMRMGEDECQRVAGDISFTAGSCRLYHIGEPENDEPMLTQFSMKDAKYGEHEGGFGCHRCEYGGKAASPDPEGRESWCSFWGMHIDSNACCAEWDEDKKKDKEEVKTSAEKPKCPHCGSDDYGLMPSDFETAKCNACGKNWDHGIVDGINNPYPKKASKLTPGGKGLDRNGEYDVVSIKGGEITFKYSDGVTQTGDLAIKQRINDGIEAEKARANAPKKVPGYLAEDEILWTPEMAHFLGYLAGPGRTKIFAEAPPKYEEAVINKYHDLTGTILDEAPGKFNIAPETKWSPEMTVMFKPTDEMPDEIARIAQKPGLVNRNQFAWSLIRQGFRIGEKPNIEYIRKKVPDGLTDYFDLGAEFTPSAEYADKQSSKTASQELYHVTRTDAVSKIQKKGILPMQTSNWVKGEGGDRYGGGEVFAFDHAEDAVRWAAKMDWDFNKGMGTGKISIVIFDPAGAKWEEDTADPMSHATAKGNWLKSLQAVKPSQIKKVVPVTIDMTRAVVQGKPVSLNGMEKEADVPTKSYGMGTPIGGTDNPDAGAEDDPTEGAAGEATMDMTSSLEKEAGREYNDMFTAILAMPNGNNFKAEIDDNITWAKSKLKKSDRVTWYLRWYRLSLEARNFPDLLERDLKKQKVQKQDIPNISQLKSSLDHFMGLQMKPIDAMQFGTDTPDDVLGSLDQLEQETVETRVSESHAMPTDFRSQEKSKGDTIFIQLPDGWAWWLLDRASCPMEAAAMGHCGNSPRENTKDRILSLREPVKTKKGENTWAPHATFILRQGGLLGEMKGRGNSKPGKELHPAIVALLKDKRIFGLLGGGFAPEKNFKWEDLTQPEQKAIQKANPNFGKEPDWESLGKGQAVIAEIAEKLGIPADDKGKVSFNHRIDAFVINTWDNVVSMCQQIGSQDAVYAAQEAMNLQRKGEERETSDVDDNKKIEVLSQQMSVPGMKTLQRYLEENDPYQLETFVSAQQGYNKEKQFALDLTRKDQLFSMLDYLRRIGGGVWNMVDEAFNMAVDNSAEEAWVDELHLALGDYLSENSYSANDKKPVTDLFYGPEGSPQPYDWSASPIYEGISFEDAKKLAAESDPGENDLSTSQLYISINEPDPSWRQERAQDNKQFIEDPVGAFEYLLQRGGIPQETPKEQMRLFRSSLLNKKKALVEMHETPTMLPPRTDVRRHIDQQEQQAITDDVMQGVAPGQPIQHKPGQIDPRINPTGRAASKTGAKMIDLDQIKQWAQRIPDFIKNFECEPVAGAIELRYKGKAIGWAGLPIDKIMEAIEPYVTNKNNDNVDPYQMEVVGGKQADYTQQDWMDDEAADYQLDQVRDAEKEAKRHFMQEDYIQQICDDYIPPKTMDEMWEIMGDEYTAEFYGTPYTREPDFTDQETDEGWQGRKVVNDSKGNAGRMASCPKCKTSKLEVVDDGAHGGTKTAALLHCGSCDGFYTAT